MAFEQLMAEATAKREKKEDKKKDTSEKKSHRGRFGHGSHERSTDEKIHDGRPAA
jgi:hypothetical protein